MTLTLKQVDIGRGLDSKNRVTTNQKHPIDSLKPKRKEKKRKLQANITDERRQKIPQQNTSKENPTTH